MQYDPSDKLWLKNSSWNPRKATTVLIHGYGSGDDDIPIVILKEGKESFLSTMILRGCHMYKQHLYGKYYIFGVPNGSDGAFLNYVTVIFQSRPPPPGMQIMFPSRNKLRVVSVSKEILYT